MDTHQNAALTPIGRARLVALVVEQGWSQRAAARALQVSPKTVARWIERQCRAQIDRRPLRERFDTTLVQQEPL